MISFVREEIDEHVLAMAQARSRPHLISPYGPVGRECVDITLLEGMSLHRRAILHLILCFFVQIESTCRRSSPSSAGMLIKSESPSSLHIFSLSVDQKWLVQASAHRRIVFLLISSIWLGPLFIVLYRICWTHAQYVVSPRPVFVSVSVVVHLMLICI